MRAAGAIVSGEPRLGQSRNEARPRFDVERVRRDFPALDQEIHGKPLVYLDSAASAHKPRAVIDAVTALYCRDYSNVHRGVHTLSVRATEAYEGAREKIRRFLGAERLDEVVFTRSTTEAVNLVAQSFARPRLRPGDEILISTMEHHSNIVPWQIVCEQTQARLRVVPIDEHGELDLGAYEELLGERTRLVAMVHVSNALGTINPAHRIVELARERSVPTLLDGAQAAPHLPLDVARLGCDFYAFSGHKLFGPTGIGVLYARSPWLDKMVPYQGGGEMIRSVSFEKTEYAEPPHKFEAGTPNIAGAVGLGAAVDYLADLDGEGLIAYERDLLAYTVARLEALPAVRLVGTPAQRAAVVSFVVEGAHAHDVGTILDAEGIAVRVGHHCAQPVMDRFRIPATVRASLALYNTCDDVDRLIAGLGRVAEVFGR